MIPLLSGARATLFLNRCCVGSRPWPALPRANASAPQIHAKSPHLGENADILDLSTVWLDAESEFGSLSASLPSHNLQDFSNSSWQLHFFPCVNVARCLAKDVEYVETQVKALPTIFPDLQQWRFQIESFNIQVLAALVENPKACKQRLTELQIIFPQADVWDILLAAPWLLFEPMDLTVLITRLMTLR